MKLLILTNKWTGTKIVYPQLFNENEEIKVPYSPSNWIFETFKLNY